VLSHPVVKEIIHILISLVDNRIRNFSSLGIEILPITSKKSHFNKLLISASLFIVFPEIIYKFKVSS